MELKEAKVFPFKECPHFHTCECCCCPLDFLMTKRGYSQEDLTGESKCRATRRTRERIAFKYPGLPTGGRTLREVNRDRRRATWNALPLEERQRRLAKLQPPKSR